MTDETLCQRQKRRLSALKTDRTSYEPHWRELRDHFQPRTGRFQIGEERKGDKKHQYIVNNTTIRASNTLSSGLMAGLTSPARPWFRLSTPDPGLAEIESVKQWLHAVALKMRDLFTKSNLYNVLPSMYTELGVYGTALALVIEDDEEVFRFMPITIGRYWLATNFKSRVDSVYREMSMTVRQLVQQFGLDNCSGRVQNMHSTGNLESPITVIHCIEPNEDFGDGALGPAGMRFRSSYWEVGGDKDKYLRQSGFRSSPLLAPRWDVLAEDVYGSSPGMNALGDAKQLQLQEKRKAQAIDKLVDPPMTAPTSLRNQRVSLLPGDVTYVDVNQGQQGYIPVYQIKPDLQGMLLDIEACEERVNAAYFVDLFLMLAMSDRRQITAREIEERHEEKLLMLGPVLERLNDELLDPLIDRCFSIMVDRSRPFWDGVIDGEPLIPPPPEEMQGQNLKVEYISVLAQAQKLVGISSVDRLIGFVGQLAAVPQWADAVYKIDPMQVVDEYADMLGTSPRITRSDDDVAAILEERAQQQAAMAMGAAMQPFDQAASAIKKLSEANVDGDNGLTRVVENVNAA
jgi:head-to-tail connecting protein